MASSARNVVSVDTQTKRVQFQGGSWASLNNLSKVELIKVGSFLKVTWGGTPMHKPLSEIRNCVEVAMETHGMMVQPTVVKPIVRTTEPVPAKAVVPTGSSLDAVIATMVANIMATIPVGIDEDAVRNIVSDVVDPIAIDNAVALSRLNDKIEAMQPKVTQIIVKDRPAVTLKGVQHQAFGDIMTSVK